uniref:Remorin C-terminal domain-containing protein n=1 Tax=Kalanchoe fedtschenkoi TaxID=63787 RepID=A0A7N0US83_KALFE
MMMNDHPPPPPPQRTLSGTSHHQNHGHDDPDETLIREIHALQTPPRARRWEEASSHVSSNSLSMASDNFTTMSREFSALVVAGSAIENDHTPGHDHHHHDANSGSSHNNMLLAMIEEGRDEVPEETNPLAIVHHQDISSRDSISMPPVASPGRIVAAGPSSVSSGHGEISVQRVKKEEVESKITAWQNAKIAKVNNRFKREDAVIGGWENAQVERASASMKKVEKKLRLIFPKMRQLYLTIKEEIGGEKGEGAGEDAE